MPTAFRQRGAAFSSLHQHDGASERARSIAMHSVLFSLPSLSFPSLSPISLSLSSGSAFQLWALVDPQRAIIHRDKERERERARSLRSLWCFQSRVKERKRERRKRERRKREREKEQESRVGPAPSHKSQNNQCSKKTNQ